MTYNPDKIPKVTAIFVRRGKMAGHFRIGCPYCAQRHYHGAGYNRVRDGAISKYEGYKKYYGDRGAHCHSGIESDLQESEMLKNHARKHNYTTTGYELVPPGTIQREINT